MNFSDFMKLSVCFGLESNPFMATWLENNSLYEFPSYILYHEHLLVYICTNAGYFCMFIQCQHENLIADFYFNDLWMYNSNFDNVSLCISKRESSCTFGHIYTSCFLRL